MNKVPLEFPAPMPEADYEHIERWKAEALAVTADHIHHSSIENVLQQRIAVLIRLLRESQCDLALLGDDWENTKADLRELIAKISSGSKILVGGRWYLYVAFPMEEPMSDLSNDSQCHE